jgi:hypothetical protein
LSADPSGRAPASDREALTRSTLTPPARLGNEAPPFEALTVLCHPDPRRVGERAALTALNDMNKASISRSEPLFARGEDGPGRPLEDPYLSRQPVELSRAGGPGGTAILLRPPSSGASVQIDGRPLSQPILVEGKDLVRGAVVELSGRVALLLRRERARPPAPGLPEFGLLGASQGILAVRQAIQQVAALPIAVLLRGETGCGKELVARTIAQASPTGEPFIAVNMGAVPPSVAASELFGSAKGAFTGAVASKPTRRSAAIRCTSARSRRRGRSGRSPSERRSRRSAFERRSRPRREICARRPRARHLAHNPAQARARIRALPFPRRRPRRGAAHAGQGDRRGHRRDGRAPPAEPPRPEAAPGEASSAREAGRAGRVASPASRP